MNHAINQNEYKDSAVGRIPVGWDCLSIGRLVNSYLYGPRFSSKDYDENGNVKTIRGTDVTSNGEILYNQAPTAFIDTNVVVNHSLKNGDVLMITTADCGITAVFEEQDIPYIASAYAVKFTPNNSLFPHFLKFYMQTEKALNQVNAFVRKGTVANLSGSDVLKIKVPHPPLAEQEKIASILTTVDEVIEKTESQISKLQDLKKGMMQDLLTKGIGHTQFKDSPVGRIPVNWEIFGVTDFCSDIFLGLTTKVDYVKSGGIPLVRAKDINIGYLTFDDGLQISKRQHQELTKYRKPKRDDILITKSGTLGICALVDTDVEFSVYESIIVLQSNKNLCYSQFLLYLMRDESNKDRMLGETVGSSVKHLNLLNFRRLKVVLPQMEEQKKIASILTSIDSKIEVKRQKLQQTQNLMQSLMQDLLTGKVRVKVN